MKKIKDYFTKKRFKLLKNNRGFSLVEVLIAVSIIGIISAIAVPQFQDYRANASLVAGDSTANNIVRAYNNCIALNTYAQCNTLTGIKVSCSECTDGSHASNGNFCVHYDKKIGAKDFRMCVSVNSAGTVNKTIGGDFEVCHKFCNGARTNSTDPCHTEPTAATVKSPIKTCTSTTVADDCGTAPANWAYSCAKNVGAAKGTCVSNTCS